MNQASLEKSLSSLPIGELRYFDSIGSTNDEALAWATGGAPDFSLVFADEQTTGRGRAERRWVTPRGVALAFSLILRPERGEKRMERSGREETSPSLVTGLGAVALAEALKIHGLKATIKWPNDVLLSGRKVAGILAESVWTGEALDVVVLGMGVNLLAGSNPPDRELLFPATSVEAELGRPLEREGLAHDILSALVEWRPRLATGELVKAWEEKLLFRGETVHVTQGNGKRLEGRVVGLDPDGSLRLLAAERDKVITVHFGEIHLRPAV